MDVVFVAVVAAVANHTVTVIAVVVIAAAAVVVVAVVVAAAVGGGVVDAVAAVENIVVDSVVPNLVAVAVEFVVHDKFFVHDFLVLLLLVNIVVAFHTLAAAAAAAVVAAAGYYYYYIVVMDQWKITFFDLDIVACTFDLVVMRINCYDTVLLVRIGVIVEVTMIVEIATTVVTVAESRNDC